MSTIRINLLGAFEAVADDGRPLVPTGKQRTLLAALAVRCGRPVSTDVLIDTLWDGDPPPSARTTLRGTVRRLRRALGQPRADAACAVRSTPNGYQLDLDADAVDLHLFRRLRAEAADARGTGREPELLRRALGLWRGEALCDVASDALRGDLTAAVEEERIQTTQRLMELETHAGQYERVITAARRLIAEHPLQERFREQLVRALEGAGRRPEALNEYERARVLLADELGVSPGAGLQRLYRRLLTDAEPDAEPEPGAGCAPVAEADAVPGPEGGAARPAGAVPRQVPLGIPGFTGRASALATLDSLLRAGADTAPPVVIEGAAGMGKSALAVHWAHRAADHFPDGQLYLDLRGYEARPAVEPYDALASLLRGIGVPDAGIPDDTADRAALFRSRTADARLLVLLDNARDAEQVTELLPAQSCLVVVTSRRRLGGLVVRWGARRVGLGPLDDAEVAELLGDAVADPDRTVMAELARLTDGLPLAVRLLAEYARRCPGTPAAELAALLRDDRLRLDLLDSGDGRDPGLREAWRGSVLHLEPGARALFELLGTHPMPDMTVDEAASYTGAEWRRAYRDLESLAALHLVEPLDRFRYRLPALTCLFAREWAAARRNGPRTTPVPLTYHRRLAA
ncbi:BTAD domain-containing putative transcriptional regulator [Streptomyces sp. BRA346]|uniref:BTAD domain-containing putative transcriptional regulator n=1 Tax=Streptomyces sp. BRA346 TaxID=2878199 RepID=UPI004062FDAA